MHTHKADPIERSTPASTGLQTGMARVSVIIVIVALVLVSWGVIARSRASTRLKDATEEQVALPVQVLQPKPAGGELALVLPGNVQALSEAPIYARTSGYLKRWLVDIGTPVKAGQLLAEIDAPELDQQQRSVQAQMANAQANQQIAKVTADRWRDLRESDSVSQQEADEKTSTAAASAASLRGAQAEQQRVGELIGFKKIVAPFDGVITARKTDVGDLINTGSAPGDELFRIADMKSLRLYVNVPQQYAAALQPGLEAEVRFPDRPGMKVVAKLARTSGAIDATSRTLLAELVVDNADNQLLPGGYAEVHFKLPASASVPALVIPSNTLLFRGDGMRAATVGADNKVLMKPITIGRDLGTQVEVVDGLTADDRVIIAPPDSLVDGIAVRIVQPAADEADPAKKSAAS